MPRCAQNSEVRSLYNLGENLSCCGQNSQVHSLELTVKKMSHCGQNSQVPLHTGKIVDGVPKWIAKYEVSEWSSPYEFFENVTIMSSVSLTQHIDNLGAGKLNKASVFNKTAPFVKLICYGI